MYKISLDIHNRYIPKSIAFDGQEISIIRWTRVSYLQHACDLADV